MKEHEKIKRRKIATHLDCRKWGKFLTSETLKSSQLEVDRGSIINRIVELGRKTK